MNKVLLLSFLSFYINQAISQNIDSLLANPPVIELSISNPQPRQGEEFIISYDPGYIQAQIFKSAFGKLEPADDFSGSQDREFKVSVKSNKLGKETFGPFNFVINGVACKTTAVNYEIINKLPEVKEGIWIRYVTINDSIFCIILEQRIPTEDKMEKTATNETRYWSEPISTNQVKIKYSKQIEGLRSHTTTTNSSQKYIYNKSGERLDFQYIFSIAYYEKIEKIENLEITKDWFENLPASYKFENIKVQ